MLPSSSTDGDLSVLDGNTIDETDLLEEFRCDGTTVSIVVVGASGDLAKKKIFPALFALYYQGMLPEKYQIFGYSRSKMSDEDFRDTIVETLTCRIDAK